MEASIHYKQCKTTDILCGDILVAHIDLWVGTPRLNMTMAGH